MIVRASNGHSAVFNVAGAVSLSFISNPNGTWNAGGINPGSFNFYESAGTYRIRNSSGVARTFDMLFIGYTGTNLRDIP